MAKKKQNSNSSRKVGKLAKLVGGLTIVGLGAFATHVYSSRTETPQNHLPKHSQTASSFDSVAFNSAYGRITEQSQKDVDVILIPQSHPLERPFDPDFEKKSTVGDISLLCKELYDNYGARSIILEGILPQLVKQYNRNGKLNTVTSRSREAMYPFLDERSWNLYAAEDELLRRKQWALEQPFRRLRDEFIEHMRGELEDHLETVYEARRGGMALKNRKFVDAQKRILEERVRRLADSYNGRIDRAFHSVESNLIYLKSAAREENVTNTCRELIKKDQTPVIIVYGAAHTNGLVLKFKNKDVAYCVLEPRSLPQDTSRQINPEVIRTSYHVAGQKLIYRMDVAFFDGKMHVRFR